MCLINFKFQDHPKYKLIVAANRDEFYERPTDAAHFWPDHPMILAGRDLRGHGTWLGISKEGRFAALTNYRDIKEMRDDKQTRGEIVSHFLKGDESIATYQQRLLDSNDLYNGYNLIFGTPDELFYYNNIENRIIQLEKGLYSLSNRFLNTPWPKVEKGKELLAQATKDADDISSEQLFEFLQHDEIAEDDRLPNTGVGIELERQLSPLFIKTDGYGTRCSTVLLITNEGQVLFKEWTYIDGSFGSEKSYTFKLPAILNQK